MIGDADVVFEVKQFKEHFYNDAILPLEQFTDLMMETRDRMDWDSSDYARVLGTVLEGVKSRMEGHFKTLIAELEVKTLSGRIGTQV